MKEEDWINAHIKMFEYSNGVSRLLIPDNLKVEILSHLKHENPVFNRSYKEFTDYYNMRFYLSAFENQKINLP